MTSTANPVGKMEVRGKVFDVEHSVYANVGTFKMEIGGKRLDAPTWELLYKKAMTETKQQSVKVAIPVARFINHGIGNQKHLVYEEGVVTGIHAANGNILVKWGRHDQEQMTGYDSGRDIFNPMQQEQVVEMIRLSKVAEEANKALDEYEERFKIRRLDQIVKEEIEKKASELP